MSISIIRVSSPMDLTQFIDLPYRLHLHDPNWVAPVRSEVKKVLGDGNPFWKHADKALFLAYEKEKVVGRIAAIIDFNHIRFHGETVGFWGFFESERSEEVALALFEAAEDFLSRRGMDISRGPFNPSTNDECGLLIKGFDRPPKIMMPHNPAYYSELVEECGYAKVKDLLAFYSTITPEPVARLGRIADRISKNQPDLFIRPVNLKEFDREIDHVLQIYNAAWEKNWGFVPMDEEEVRYMAKRLKPLVVPELLLLAFMAGEPVAFMMALPDYNQALKGLNGKLFPVNLFRIIYRIRKIDSIRVITMGIKSSFRSRGIDAVLYHEGLKTCLKKGYKTIEFSWILEDNKIIQKPARMIGAEQDKVYRIYERMLKDAA